MNKPSEAALELVRKVRERRANFDSSDEAAALLIDAAIAKMSATPREPTPQEIIDQHESFMGGFGGEVLD